MTRSSFSTGIAHLLLARHHRLVVISIVVDVQAGQRRDQVLHADAREELGYFFSLYQRGMYCRELYGGWV